MTKRKFTLIPTSSSYRFRVSSCRLIHSATRLFFSLLDSIFPWVQTHTHTLFCSKVKSSHKEESDCFSRPSKRQQKRKILKMWKSFSSIKFFCTGFEWARSKFDTSTVPAAQETDERAKAAWAKERYKRKYNKNRKARETQEEGKKEENVKFPHLHTVRLRLFGHSHTHQVPHHNHQRRRLHRHRRHIYF